MSISTSPGGGDRVHVLNDIWIESSELIQAHLYTLSVAPIINELKILWVDKVVRVADFHVLGLVSPLPPICLVNWNKTVLYYLSVQ